MPGDGCGHWNQRGCHDRDRCDCRDRESWRVPLFNCDSSCPTCDCGCGAQTVRLENPCCPGECAEVTLSVDSCGNLVVCVHKNPCRRNRNRC